MIKSMTGYGAAKGLSGKIEISVELKSVNNRYLDCTVKLPRVFLALEKPLKSLVQERISRGKVDVFVSIDMSNSDDVEIKVNSKLAQGYVSALRQMAEDFDLDGAIKAVDLTRFPDIIQAEKIETDIDKLCEDCCAILTEAIDKFDEMRHYEGAKLKDDISARLDEIEKHAIIIERSAPEIVEAYRLKIENRIKEILEGQDIDQTRILTEAAIFADRTAIDEELIRLRSHISQLRQILNDSEPVGRKIDFLLQEFNREVNTISSKSSDIEMSKVAVDLKAEVEKIREQAQNIE
jgi:uncharacterized protein (TIGR00255 family)